MLIFFLTIFPEIAEAADGARVAKVIVANRRRLCCGWDDFDKYHDKFKTVRHNFSNRNCIIIGGRTGGKWRRRWRWKWKWKWRWRWEMMKGTIGALILPGKGYNMCELAALPFLFIIELSVGWQTERGAEKGREREREKGIGREGERIWLSGTLNEAETGTRICRADCIRGTPRA